VNVLFLHAREHLTPDLSVHYSLMAAFDPARTKAFVVSNSQAKDIERHLQANAVNPHLTSFVLPLGSASDNEPRSLWKFTHSLLSCFFVLPRLMSLVRGNNIDVIHSTDRPRDIFLATLLAKASRVPNIIHLHTNAAAYNNRVIMWGFRRASAFVTVSNFIRQEGLELGLPFELMHPVPNSTDSGHFDPALYQDKTPELRLALRSRYNLPESALVIGVIARMNKWKGQRELIEAMAGLIGRYPDLHLLMVGGASDPQEFSAYEKQLSELSVKLGVNDHVIFGGRFKDVRPVLLGLDMFALPSYAEPFGLAITEAMAMEVPVIACNSGGVPDIIDHRRTGFLVEPRSSAGLVEAVDFLIQHPEEARQMGRAGRMRIVEAYPADKIAAQVSDIYQSIL